MKVKKVIRRILAGTVVVSLFFTSAVMADDLETSAAKTKESSQSCSNSLDLSDTNEKWPGIGPITNPKYGKGGWSYVYYGSKIYGGVRYRVLDKAATQFSTKKTILLDSDVVFSERPYRLSTDPYEWDGSDLRSFLNGTTYGNFYFEFFTDNERNAIVPSYKSAPDPDDGTFSGAFTKLTGEKIFPRFTFAIIIISFAKKYSADSKINGASILSSSKIYLPPSFSVLSIFSS